MAYTAIDDPEAYFQAYAYTGDGNSGRALTLPGDTDLAPNLVWVKQYDTNRNHIFANSVSGASKNLYTDLNDAEDGISGPITAFGSDGFTVSNSANANQDSGTYASWSWNESATAGFDIVAYTGNNTARTISHSLSAVPHFMIIKNRSTNESWRVYHHKNTSAPETDYLILDTDAATADNPQFNDTAPTSSVFSVGTAGAVNNDGDNLIAFLWSGKQGYSKFGSYEGNGDADGPFLYTGFRPAYFLVKEASDSGGFWGIYDNKRIGYNGPGNHHLKADVNTTGGATDHFDFLATGLKCRTSSGYLNESGENYIYAAFAEAPLVNSEGVPNNAR